MSLMAFSPKQPALEVAHPFARTAAALLSQFTVVRGDAVGPGMVAALAQVTRALGGEAGAVIEFADELAVKAIHTWPEREAAIGLEGPDLPQWLLDREWPQVWQHGTCSGLSLPVIVAEQLVCALVVWGRRAPHTWPEPVIEQARLFAGIFGLALRRCDREVALRESASTIERLNARLAASDVDLHEEIKLHHDFDSIVGESPALRRALVRLGEVAPTNATVLLQGETGTGKELFARALHDRSRRRTRPLVRVNCAALPPTLVESELFGHEKGAFTGAVTLRQGRFELADGGTVFLDEIGDLAPDIQVKLLRVLQEGEFERVGSSRTRRVDVRVIAATHRDLEADVAAGRFRADLFYRLSVYPIVVPALRQRLEDIPALVWFFVHRRQRELDRRITKVPQAAMQALQQHAWPGNVRELENVVERALIRSTGDTLLLDETFGPLRPQAVRRAGPADATLEALERCHIAAVLDQCGWRINGRNNAAVRLGLNPNTLRYRMNKLGIFRRDSRDGRAPVGATPGAATRSDSPPATADCQRIPC